MTPPARFRVAGNTCIDVLVRDVVEEQDPARDGWGDNVQFHDRPIEAAIGGGGVGPALVLADLGHPVALNTNIGSDTWGQIASGKARSAGVELEDPLVAASATNVILLRADGSRTSHYHSGQKVAWKRSLEGEGPTPGGEWFFASGYGMVDESDLRELLRTFSEFRRRGIATAFDPSPWFGGCASTELMLSVFAELTCLVATEEELLVWHRAESAEQLARDLLDAGPAQVVVKRGPQGATWACREGGSGSVPTDPVQSTNTTGAGDAFNGRLLHGLCQGGDCASAVGDAVAIATLVARRGRGVQGALGDPGSF